MKNILLATVLLFTISSTKAQVVQQVLREAARNSKPFTGTPVLVKGSQVLQLGYGFPNNIDGFFNLGGLGALFTTKDEAFGPASINYEYFVKDNTGLGLTLQYASAKRTYDFNILGGSLGLDPIYAELKAFSILGSYVQHLRTTDKWDPYFKGSIGVNIWNGGYKTKAGTEYKKMTLPTPVAYNALAGMRYFATENFGPYLEASYGNLKFTVNGGVAFKLK